MPGPIDLLDVIRAHWAWRLLLREGAFDRASNDFVLALLEPLRDVEDR
jgi:hypothetical protein